MPKVIFKQADYQYNQLKPVIFQMIDDLGPDLVKSRQRVLIKPNLLSAAKPEKAITTHPLVVRIVAEYVLAKGGRPVISDSPPLGSFKKILNEGEYTKTFRDLDIEFKAFEASTRVNIGEPFGHIDIAADPLEADLVINLAKLKTHSQMLLTLGVKNMFGCIVGYRKPEWHVRAGVDRDLFARLLVQIYQAIKPAITIIDGIWAMEGQGPGKSGTPRQLGVMVASRDAIEADRSICRMLGLNPDLLLTNRAAMELGLISQKGYINGDFHIISDFKFPVLSPLAFGPKLLQKVMRKHLIQRPVVNDHVCTLCEECIQYCPSKAISPVKDRISFDYDQCIRCYCCIEICPHGALHSKEPLTGKIIRRLSNIR